MLVDALATPEKGALRPIGELEQTRITMWRIRIGEK